MRLRAALLLGFLLVAGGLRAECVGKNLIDALPPGQLAALRQTADAGPFAKGNLWRASKDGKSVTVVGTYHLDDPRHDATLTLIAPDLSRATALMVEAGPEEEAAMLAHVADHPERLVNQSGPTLVEALSDADWQRLSDALRARGVPPVFAARLQPWYVTTMLAIPVCQFSDPTAKNGLDRRLMERAAAQGLPVLALEPFDTLFTIFDSFTLQDQVTMLVQTLDAGAVDNDMAITLADSYFAGESRLFWEFSKQQMLTLSDVTQTQADHEFALVERVMINHRNHAWVPVISAAAAKGPLVVAFGALHLSGSEGVLNLLVQDGWTVAPLRP